MEAEHDFNLTDEELNELHQRNVSREFMVYMSAHVDADDVPHVRKKVVRYLRDGDLDWYVKEAGDFVQDLLEGRLYSAFLRADLTNFRLIAREFNKEHIIQAGVEEGEPIEHVRHMVTERLEDHA